MKRSTIYEISFVSLAAITGLVVFFAYSNPSGLDSQTTWKDVFVGNEIPDGSLGKFHSYYIDYKNWSVYRKEQGNWNQKGFLFELKKYSPAYKEYKSSQEIYSLYKSVVSNKLEYTYVGTGADWLIDLCQLRLYSHQEYTVQFLNYDDSLLWETNSFLRQKITYEGEKPVREGYVFHGWDQSFDNVFSDLIIRPVFEKIT